MKNKTLTIILSAVLIGCIGVSIYQYQTTVNLKNELSVLTNTKNELTTEIENKTAELNNITSEIEEANNAISELTANVESLTASSKEIQSEIDSLESKNAITVNSTSDNVILGEDEYKGDDEVSTETDNGTISEEDRATFDSIWDELEKENPELFASPAPSTTNQGSYEHVGTPDSSDLPTYDMNAVTSDVAPGTVY